MFADLYDRVRIEYVSMLMQLITYVVIIDPVHGKFFINKRIGGEERLLNMYSLGFGGHIDGTDYQPPKSFEKVAYTGAIRELREELTINKKDLDLKHIGYTYSYSGETDNHLGIVFVLESGTAFIKEKDKLIGQWVTVDDIKNKYYFQLESWSKSIFDHFYESEQFQTKYPSMFKKLA